MANITGTAGYVLYDGSAVVGVKEWSMNYAADMFDATNMSDTAPTHKSYISGLKSATGSFSGNVTAGDADAIITDFVPGTSYAIELYTDGTDKYAFTAFISNIDKHVPNRMRDTYEKDMEIVAQKIEELRNGSNQSNQ